VKNKEVEAYQVEQGKDFVKEAKRLIGKKKFFSLPKQIDALIRDLEEGKLDGDRIAHREMPMPHDVYKLRLPNPDANAGKSNGYRVIYLVVTENKIIIILTIYYKKEQPEADDTYINGLIDGYFMSGLQTDETEDEHATNNGAEWLNKLKAEAEDMKGEYINFNDTH
jgi:mRNA-degrading endonuclease RelE of RelBE toxin-antitoxin system